MSQHCGSPIPFETLVAYSSDDLPPAESEAVEEHAMSCASCTAASARVAAIARRYSRPDPALVSRDVVAKLRARGVRVVDNPVKPGDRRRLSSRPDVDVLLHRLGGLDLAHGAGRM